MASDQGTSSEVVEVKTRNYCIILFGVMLIHCPMVVGLAINWLTGFDLLAYGFYVLQLLVWWSIVFRTKD